MGIDYQELLSQLVQEIQTASDRHSDGECREDELPTAAELARKLNYRLEAVKKKLRILKDAEVIQSVGMTPKRYRFNAWALKSMDDSHPFYELLTSTEQ